MVSPKLVTDESDVVNISLELFFLRLAAKVKTNRQAG